MKWKTCPQNRNYKISDTGLCKSTHPRFEDRFLTPAPRKNIDVYVLCKNYTKHAYPIRTLVYTAFVGNIPKGYVVYNKDGNVKNNRLKNLGIISRSDKTFFYCKRTKKLPRLTYKNKYTFYINGKTYHTSSEVVKEYKQIGTRQNLCFQADRWIAKRAPRGKERNPLGFVINGVLIWASKRKVENPTKIRMDSIKQKYNLVKKEAK